MEVSIERGSSVSGVSASFASGAEIEPRVRHVFFVENVPLPLIQEEQAFSFFRKNEHLILVNCSGRLANEQCG